MDRLSGKVAVVTGAASGIGRALALRFALAGMRVVLADLEVARLEDAAAEVGQLTEVLAVPTDVARAESVDALAAAAFSHFGTAHVVCNNAGVVLSGRAWSVPREQWAWLLGVNLWGVVHGIAAFVPRLIEQDEGHVMNTASGAGLLAYPGAAPYVASKYAVVGLSETLFLDLAEVGSRVGVSVLCPGKVDTDIFRSERNWDTGFGMPPRPLDQDTVDAGRRATAPSVVAEAVYDAVVTDRFWVLPHPRIADWALRRVQGMVEGCNPSPPGA